MQQNNFNDRTSGVQIGDNNNQNNNFSAEIEKKIEELGLNEEEQNVVLQKLQELRLEISPTEKESKLKHFFAEYFPTITESAARIFKVFLES